VLASTVREAATRFGDLPAFVSAERWPLSFAQLDRLSDEAAVGLAELGVGEGDLVALALPSTPDYVVAYAALAKLGAISAGINPRSTPAERARSKKASAPMRRNTAGRLVIAPKAFATGSAIGARSTQHSTASMRGSMA